MLPIAPTQFLGLCDPNFSLHISPRGHKTANMFQLLTRDISYSYKLSLNGNNVIQRTGAMCVSAWGPPTAPDVLAASHACTGLYTPSVIVIDKQHAHVRIYIYRLSDIMKSHGATVQDVEQCSLIDRKLGYMLYTAGCALPRWPLK